MSLLGVHIATTSCTAAVFSLDGRVLGRGRRDYPLRHPEHGAMELDADLVMARVREAIIEAVDRAGRRYPVRALGAAVQGESTMPVDKAGRVLTPTMTTFDSRPGAEANFLGEELGRLRIQKITGLPMHPMYSLCKLLWWKNHRPDIMRRAWKFLGFGDLFLHRLGLEPVMDESMGGRTMAMDLETKCWSDELLRAAGISRGLLPRLAPSSSVVGVISDQTAHDYHLPPGVLVVAGGHDQACGALGCGAIAPGMAMDALGAAECLAVTLPAPVVNDAMQEGRYGCYPHVVPDRYLALAFNFAGGSLLQWYRTTWGEAEDEESRASGLDFFEILMSKASSGPASVLVLPHFTTAGTPWLDAASRGAIVGLRFSTGKAEIIRGMLEGLIYEMRVNLEALAAAGIPVSTARLIGTGAASAAWQQLKANIYNRPVEGVNMPDAPCLGAALLAGLGIKLYANADEAVRRAVQVAGRADPQPEEAEQYARQFERYAQLYLALKPVVRDLP